MRFQQLTGPVMAKGVEDTAFYSYNRLVVAERGRRRPRRVRHSRPTTFHARLPRAARSAGRAAMLASTTHDTKRSEDVRARLAPPVRDPAARGRRPCERWCEPQPRGTSATAVPDRNLEYLLYQTLVGAWPIDARAGRGLHDEGGARGQGAHVLDAAPTRPTRTAIAARSLDGACWPTQAFRARPGALRGEPARSSRGGSTRWRRRCSS